MQTLLFCFANHSISPLKTLEEEFNTIDGLLDSRNHLKHFLKVPVPFASTESVVRKINVYHDSLAVFHFSGHANHTLLQLEDTAAGAGGIARLLGRCPNLKLVFLNGCSTLKHIEQLAAQPIQAVIIATCAPVDDPIAAKFSIAFYEALANQKSVGEAIEEAKLSIIDAEADLLKLDDVTRGLGMNKELNKNQWYVYCPILALLQWKLPAAVQTSTYTPNAVIRRVLFTALGNKDRTFYDAYTTVQSQYDDEGLTDWVHKQILERLPYPLAEPLRRLFRREFSQEENRWQPIALSRERLENYLILVNNSLYLVISTMLAQVRDRLLLLKKSNELPKETVDSATFSFLQELQINGWLDLLPENLVKVVQRLHKLLTQWKVSLFAEGMDEFIAELIPSSSLYESLVFFHELQQQLALSSGVPNVEYYCEMGEEHLKQVLERIGFWTQYRLESIGQIRIITYFDLLSSRYIHEKVVLRSTFDEEVAKKMLAKNEQDSPWNCQSVVIVNQKNQYLNLSPFLIDRNVYKKSNTTFDLYTFNHFQEGTLSFIRLAYPSHPPLAIRADGSTVGLQDDFSILLEQERIIFELIHLETEVSPQPQHIPTLRI